VNLSSLQIRKSYTSQALSTHMVVSFIMLKPEPFYKFIIETKSIFPLSTTPIYIVSGLQ
jgi:hypothetical protein